MQIFSSSSPFGGNKAGADDALMLDTRGYVAETNATHLFVVRNGEVATSHVLACPEGITRATVLEICEDEKIPYRECDLTLDDFYGASEVFCTGTMGELAGVIRIDDRTIGTGEIGPMTQRLSGCYANRTGTEGFQIIR